eukprot:4718563-Amphidinium_carterae.1
MFSSRHQNGWTLPVPEVPTLRETLIHSFRCTRIGSGGILHATPNLGVFVDEDQCIGYISVAQVHNT